MSRRRTIFYTEKELAILREQLEIMEQFVADTPDDGNSWHDSLWWGGDLPADMGTYVPQEWQEENKPIWVIWDEYLYELEHMDGVPAIQEYFLKAKELEIADLLAFSHAVENDHLEI